jgi:hypothetical protein
MTEMLAEKICAPFRGGVPPLTRDEAQCLQPQAPNIANQARLFMPNIQTGNQPVTQITVIEPEPGSRPRRSR